MKLSQWFRPLIHATSVAALFVLFCPPRGLTDTQAAASSPESGWEKVKESDGIQVYARDVPNTPLVAVRGEADIDAPPGKVLFVIMDCNRAKEWVEHLESCRRVHQFSEYEYVTENHFGTPFIIKDRDFVARVKVSVDLKGQAVQAHFASTVDAAAPETGAVRGEIIESLYKIIAIDGGRRSHLVGQALVDPKGSVPKWIVNFFQRQWPISTVQALRKQVGRADIVVPPFYQNLLAASPSQAPASASPKAGPGK